MAAVDVVVVGLGAMGSAALSALARRGSRVIGIEQFSPGHAMGSSHGKTRIIRLGYFEHPSYVPLARAAFALWRDLEAKTGEHLLTVTGIVEIGRPDSTLVAGTLQASRQHALPHEVLDAKALMRRFPAFRVPDDFIALHQPDAGYVAAEPSIHAQLRLARDAGAHIRTEECVTAIEPASSGVRVVTAAGVIEAGQAIVAAGSFLPTLLPGLPARLTVTRQALAWFAPRHPAPFAAPPFPVFMLENGGVFYGFPPQTPGAPVKFAKHHHDNEAIDPLQPTRAFDTHDEATLRTALAAHLPAADGKLVETATCRYTMTADGDFIIDRLPSAPQIVVASPCSGHGFKFSPVIGEILADLVTTGQARHDIARFGFDRFA
jgi:sarcosine oxidase